ncbi:MAG: hypothetical protein K8S55_00015 [Phycisphaerae bacterium]|nr:hypothetical protein [Phycisphaerae bacterium]
MEDRDKAAEDLKVIRELMERPVKYSTQSGLAGIIAGMATLCGLAVDRYNWLHTTFADEAVLRNTFVWTGVFIMATVGVLIATRQRERKQNMPLWSGVKSRILRTILPPFLAGICLSAATIYQWYAYGNTQQGFLIPAIWMLFHGVACWQVGEFSVPEIRILGVVFLIAGIVTAAFFQAHPYWALGITFGGFHIVYGVIVWIRHGG